MRIPFKRIGRWLGITVLALVVAVTLFLNLSPQFGGSPTQAQRVAYAATGHYVDGEFKNLIPTRLMTDGGNLFTSIVKFLTTKGAHEAPDVPLPTLPLTPAAIAAKPADGLRATWFGHSASLIEIEGRNILLDPMLSIEMGPLSLVTPRRYNPVVAITADALPPIDAVLISHDHYDHLDYQTIRRLTPKTGHFYVPLGVGAHLLAWGVPAAKVTEMDWGDSVQLSDLTIVSTPARHFSGRGLTNRNSTSWSSWVLKGAAKRVFYSGDGGYGPHFRQIGAQYGPFDLAVMECGQYNADWADIHMMPEQTVQATQDVRGRVLLPVHWGAFTEAHHAWNDPIKRATAAAARLRQPIATPRLGEPVVPAGPLPHTVWWR
jgi:L-ascorbate metabolism protein UlaG (beta-lactamase superfamily)